MASWHAFPLAANLRRRSPNDSGVVVLHLPGARGISRPEEKIVNAESLSGPSAWRSSFLVGLDRAVFRGIPGTGRTLVRACLFSGGDGGAGHSYRRGCGL